MKNLYIVLFSFLFFSTSAQNWTWGLKADGSPQPSSGACNIALNHRGDMVMAGNYQKNMSFGSFTLPTADDYYSRLFLCRISSSHQIQWLKDLPIEQGNYGDDLGLAIDDDQNIYLTATDNDKIFVTKFDSLGTKLWHNDFGGKFYGYGSAIALDQFDNVYVTGGSGWGFFMAKLDYNGNTVWTKDIWVNYSDGCKISDIQVDAMGNIYFAGTYGIDKLVLDQFTITHDGGSGDNIVFGKMNTDGRFIWVKSITGYLSEPHIKLTHDRHLYMAGGFEAWMVLPEIFLYGPAAMKLHPSLPNLKSTEHTNGPRQQTPTMDRV